MAEGAIEDLYFLSPKEASSPSPGLSNHRRASLRADPDDRNLETWDAQQGFLTDGTMVHTLKRQELMNFPFGK